MTKKLVFNDQQKKKIFVFGNYHSVYCQASYNRVIALLLIN